MGRSPTTSLPRKGSRGFAGSKSEAEAANSRFGEAIFRGWNAPLSGLFPIPTTHARRTSRVKGGQDATYRCLLVKGAAQRQCELSPSVIKVPRSRANSDETEHVRASRSLTSPCVDPGMHAAAVGSRASNKLSSGPLCQGV
jgi:hypothetical protein